MGQQRGPGGQRGAACIFFALLEQGVKAGQPPGVAGGEEGFFQFGHRVQPGRVHPGGLGGRFQRGEGLVFPAGEGQSQRRRDVGGRPAGLHRLLQGVEAGAELGGGRLPAGQGDRVGVPPHPPKGAQGVVIAQGHVPPGDGGVKAEDVPQLPMAADDGGGQPRPVGFGKAQALQVDADQLLRTQPGSQPGGHIVGVAAVEILDPVDAAGRHGRVKGRRRQQVIGQLPLRDLVEGQLAGAQAALFHRHQPEPHRRGPQRVLVQHPGHNALQRGDIQPALGHELPHHLAPRAGAGGRVGQLHHVLAADGQPHIPGRLVLAQNIHGAVQTADAGAGDGPGRPPQLVQRPPDPDLIAAPGSAPGQHQPAADLCRCIHLQPSLAGPVPPVDSVFSIT